MLLVWGGAGGGVKTTSSPGLFPWKMGGAGIGPGIGWSRVQPKYSEKLIYMQPACFALTEGTKGVTMENNNIANYVNIFACSKA